MRTKQDYDADPYPEPGRQHGPFPPENITNLTTNPPPSAPPTAKDPDYIVEEQSTSVVLTGDSQGYMWLCSILSPTVDSQSVASVVCDEKKGIPRLLRKFIHQQGTARGLVFLLLLGHICERLASGYDVLLKQLDDIMEIGVSPSSPPTFALTLGGAQVKAVYGSESVGSSY